MPLKSGKGKFQWRSVINLSDIKVIVTEQNRTKLVLSDCNNFNAIGG